MRLHEVLGFRGENILRIRGNSDGQSTVPSSSVHEESIKGVEIQATYDIDPQVTKLIRSKKPEPPKDHGTVSTLAEWIVDPRVATTTTNDTLVDVMRAIVSEEKPVSIEDVAQKTGTDVEHVDTLVSGVPYLTSETTEDGHKHLNMPEVQDLLSEWKKNAIQVLEEHQILPDGSEAELVNQLITPLPSADTIFEAELPPAL